MDIQEIGTFSQQQNLIDTLKNTSFFQAAIDQIPLGILITKPRGSEIVFINKNACRLLGLPDIRNRNGANLRDFFFKAGGKFFYATKEILREDNFTSQHFRKDDYVAMHFESLVRQPGGEERFLSVSASSVKDSAGRPVSILSILKDINAKKEDEIKVQQNLQRLEYALSAAVDGLWEWDVPADKGYLSPRYREIYGFEEGGMPEDIIYWYSMLHPDDREPALTRLIAALRSDKDNYTSTYRMKTSDGTYRWIQSKAIVTKRVADGTIQKMVGTHQDISQQVALETSLKNANQNLKKEVRTQTKHLKAANQQLETILNSSSESMN